MAKTILIAAFLFLGSIYCTAQKTIQKEFSAAGVQKLSVKDDAIYKITIHSSEEKIIKVSLHVSGEHSESIVIEENISEKTLSLKTGFMPFFTLENDKLAAHKLMAIEMKLTVPSYMAVEIQSKLASVFAEGKYKNLLVSLENAPCHLHNFSGNAHLKTVSGDITVVAYSTVSGTAVSQHGIVKNELSSDGKFFVEAESINGSIILQTK